METSENKQYYKEYEKSLRDFISKIKEGKKVILSASDNYIDQYASQVENILYWGKKISEFDGLSSSETLNKSIKIDLIMALLSSEYLYIRNDYLEEFKTSKKSGTIDPEDSRIKIELSEKDRRDHDWIQIFGYSFGPFNSFSYMSDESGIRLLWVLKEPMLSLGSWLNGDKGGHWQAPEYNMWQKILEAEKEDGSRTKSSLVRHSKKILQKLMPDHRIWEETDENKIMNFVMNRIAIIELNHFPELNFKTWQSDPGLVMKWGSLNSKLNAFLIDLLDPSIVIGERNGLGSLAFYSENDMDSSLERKNDSEFFNWLCSHDYPEDTDLKYSIGNRFLTKHPSVRKKVADFKLKTSSQWKNILGALIDDNETLWLGWYHPVSSKWSDTIIDNIIKDL